MEFSAGCLYQAAAFFFFLLFSFFCSAAHSMLLSFFFLLLCSFLFLLPAISFLFFAATYQLYFLFFSLLPFFAASRNFFLGLQMGINPTHQGGKGLLGSLGRGLAGLLPCFLFFCFAASSLSTSSRLPRELIKALLEPQSSALWVTCTPPHQLSCREFHLSFYSFDPM